MGIYKSRWNKPEVQNKLPRLSKLGKMIKFDDKISYLLNENTKG